MNHFLEANVSGSFFVDFLDFLEGVLVAGFGKVEHWRFIVGF